MRQFGIGRATAGGRQRHADFRQHFIWLHGGRIKIDKEIIRGYRSASRYRLQYKRRVQRSEDHGKIRARIGMGNAPANGAAIAHLHVTDHRCCVH